MSQEPHENDRISETITGSADTVVLLRISRMLSVIAAGVLLLAMVKRANS